MTLPVFDVLIACRPDRAALWPKAAAAALTNAITEGDYLDRCRSIFPPSMRQAMRHASGGIKAHYDCIKAFSETDFTEDLKKIDVPVLIMHGEIVPIADSALLAAKLPSYTIILRFDNEENLLTWMHSQDRQRLIDKVQPFLADDERFQVLQG